MGMTIEEKYAALDELYATLPTIACQKKCGRTNCGPIQASGIETQRITEKKGYIKITERSEWVKPENFEFRHLPYHLDKDTFYKTSVFYPPDKDTMNCQFLMPVIGTCSIYSLRPMVCRLWGLVDHPFMRCLHGCVPERWVTSQEAREYFQAVLKIQQQEEE
jgi:Fe-S-cluster containining protein